LNRPFEEAKYKALLNGLEATELKLSKLLEDNRDLRIDSELFKKENLRLFEQLKPISKKLSEYLISGIYGILPKSEDYTFEGLPLIRGKDIRGISLDLEMLIKVPESYYSAKYQLEKGDILILVKGATIGNSDGVSLIQQDFGKAIFNGSVFRLRLKSINTYFVYAFMTTKFFTFQKLAGVANNGIEYNSLGTIKDYLIPNPSESFQLYIESIIKAAHQKLEQSKALYADAERLLLEELGLKDWQPSDENVAVKSFKESFSSTGRLDAEYYHPEKQKVLDWLSKMPGMPIHHHFISVNETLNPLLAPSAQLVQNYDLNDALQFFLDEKEPAPIYELGSTKNYFKRGDILISRLRSYLKEIAIADTEEKSTCVGSSEFIVLRPQSDSVCAELLLVYLRSTPVQKILKWCQSGSNHPRFMEEDLLAIKLPDRAIAMQHKIQPVIRTAIQSHRDAKRLLETAKRGVEIAIEEDEAAALRWIDGCLKD